MVSKAHTTRFGSKGAGERPLSFAEALLSGKPLLRETNTYTPTLKPRPKARFGTKGLPTSHEIEAYVQSRNHSWKFWR